MVSILNPKFKRQGLLAILVMLMALANQARANDKPRAIADYPSIKASLVSLEPMKGGKHYQGQLLRYEHGGLTLGALVATPNQPAPKGGFPILVAAHGLHPEPKRYGITVNGENWRPGDYYRSIPEAYTRRGFLVVMPDYRGHNDSHGAPYARGFLAGAYYSQDLTAAISLLNQIPLGNVRQVFLWGHSLGGEVALRSLLGTEVMSAASLWSSVGGNIWQQAYYYSRSGSWLDSHEPAETDEVKNLRDDIAALGPGFDWRSTDPLTHLDQLCTPIIIHHAAGDTGANYEWSRQLAAELTRAGKPHTFYTYPGIDHLLQGAQFEAAVDRDVEYFRHTYKTRSHIKSKTLHQYRQPIDVGC